MYSSSSNEKNKFLSSRSLLAVIPTASISVKWKKISSRELVFMMNPNSLEAS